MNEPLKILLGLIVVVRFVSGNPYFFILLTNRIVTPTGMFRNPLTQSGPDPWMTYYNGNYYLAATTWGDPSTGLTMRKASTIADLKTTASHKDLAGFDP